MFKLLGTARAKVQGAGAYDLLPTSEWGAASPSGARVSLVSWLKRRRRWVVCFLCLLASVIAIVVYLIVHPEFWRRKLVLQVLGKSNLPPLYPEYRVAEAALPQHHNKDPFAGGQKYLWIASHAFCESRSVWCLRAGRGELTRLDARVQGLAGATSCRTCS